MTMVEGEICPTTAYGELTFNPGSVAVGAYETNMHTGAWCCWDVTPLWMPAAQRGDNVILPELDGTRPYRRRKTETEVPLPMVISGAVDQDSTPWPNVLEGLRLNLEWLTENVVDPPPGAATRVAQLTTPDGFTTITADVQVLALERGNANVDELITEAVLWLRIPSGRFTEPVS